MPATSPQRSPSRHTGILSLKHLTRILQVVTPQQFHIGQTIHLRASLFTRNAALGMYEVRAVLPEEAGERRYRVKSLIEPYERVVLEQELSEA